MKLSDFLTFAQQASRSVGQGVTGLVDLSTLATNAALRPFGRSVPVEQVPFSTAWAEGKGLLAPADYSPAGIAGQTLGGLLGPIGAAKAPQIAAGAIQAQRNLNAPSTVPRMGERGAIVYHGSPHKFDAFDSSKIGTGEGAQAYGHGSYLAEAEDVAKSYVVAGQAVRAPNRTTEMVVRAIDASGGDEVAALNWLRRRMETSPADFRQLYADAISQFDSVRPAGYLYKVDLPDPLIARMLDWDKPLSQQAPGVAEVVARAFPGTYAQGRYIDPMSGGRTGRALLDDLSAIADKRGAAGFRTAEAALRRAGIPGIRYLDGGSRGAGQGTSNFVVFPGEESALRILERNGRPLSSLLTP